MTLAKKYVHQLTGTFGINPTDVFLLEQYQGNGVYESKYLPYSGMYTQLKNDMDLIYAPIDTPYKQVLITHGQGTNVPAGATRYMVPIMMQVQSSAYTIPMPAGTFKNLFVRQGTQPAGGTLTFKLFAGPTGSLVDTGIGVTFAAGSSAQDRVDNTNTYTHVAGEYIQFVLVNNDGANASAAIGGVTIEFERQVG